MTFELILNVNNTWPSYISSIWPLNYMYLYWISIRFDLKNYNPHCIEVKKKCMYIQIIWCYLQYMRGRGDHDRMVVWFTTTVQSVPIITKFVSLNPVHSEMYLIQHYVIKFVSHLRQVRAFLRVLRFPPPIKLTSMI